MTAKRLILDCDPGHDDAIAILLAEADKRLDLRAVTTVAGNAPCEATTENACALLDLAESQAPVAAGSKAPLTKSPYFAVNIHGARGLQGVELPPSMRPVDDRHASAAIVEMIMNSEPRSMTLVATGPLTNIALATILEPRIVDVVSEVLIMGGSHGPGNVTATAEFNMFFDPEAADIVFAQDWRIRLFTLDITHQLLASRPIMDYLQRDSSRGGEFLRDMMEPVAEAYEREHGMEAPPLHDPCPVAYLAEPGLFSFRRVEVDIDVSDGPMRGTTEFRPHEPFTCRGETDIHLAQTVDHEGFWNLLDRALRSLPLASWGQGVAPESPD